ncbi:serine/threonine protein kinase Kin4 [Pseudohyphozyma bogoriensis]|nr:serine/threonine protein kinase Kin4 [Pseudohyphozyma bogoriensis]
MSTPSSAYPYSPSPVSPIPPFQSPNPGPSDFSPNPNATDERRRSKRDSTASATRRREEAATRYPSPPPGGSARSRPTSLEAQLVIPPFNPNRARPSTTTSASAPPTPHLQSHQYNPYVQPQIPAMPSPSSSRPQQPPYPHRPVSAAVVPVTAQPTAPEDAYNNSASSGVPRGARASVGYMPVQSSSAGPYPQLYTPHQMPKQRIYFGPYILLQTLGEGEFGKVKLGLHSERWGEEVAIKLIKRGNVDTVQRTEKVKREIDVLKAVKHPNIVRLYDVIETEKYIGIVLEYASGGELFDHILAHRYLKEKDASRLFAQLISGVAYLHAKKIVHRDLKLENLLLDRNRNVIITDFGFANRFELAENDLMATSCGSPCYAAPELVVQDGKYVGTAVDVWSCGVILYAMLAGYLPYDDDPANPEGDNINLLYKYIINTKLTFPDWITDEPRHLLLMMLVPDPANRCTIEDVTRHPWLSKYQAMFVKSVPELEAQAQEAELFKRRALEAQRQFLIQQQQQAQAAMGGLGGSLGAHSMSRSQTHDQSAARHRSAVVTSSTPSYRQPVMETSHLPPPVPEESPRPVGASLPPPAVHAHARRNVPTTQLQPVSVGASTPVSVPMIPSFSAPSTLPTPAEDQIMDEGQRRGESRRRQEVVPEEVVASPSGRTRRSSTRHSSGAGSAGGVSDSERRKKSHRATVQVEYDGGEPMSTRSKGKARAPAPLPTPAATPVIPNEDVVMTPVETDFNADSPVPTETDALSQASVEAPTEMLTTRPSTPPLIPVPVQLPSTPPQSPPTSSAPSTAPQKRKNSGTPPVTPNPESSTPPEVHATTPKASAVALSQQTTPKASRRSTPPAPPPVSVPTPTPAPAVAASVAPVVEPPRPPSVASTASRHKKGALSTDRFSIRSLLSGSSTSLDRSNSTASRATVAAEKEKVRLEKEEAERLKSLDEVTNRRKSRRQKALSLQPFRPGTSAKVAKALKGESTVAPAPRENTRTRSSTITASNRQKEAADAAMMPPPPRPAAPSRQVPPRSSSKMSIANDEANWTPSQASSTPSGKAKAVMDWFRRRGPKGGDQVPFSTDFDLERGDRRPTSVRAPASTSSTATREGSTTPQPPPSSSSMSRGPSVVVTTPVPEEASGAQSVPSSRSASGAQSDLSHFSQASASTAATSITNSLASTPTIPSAPAAAASRTSFDDSRMRFQTGALDKDAVTTKRPDLVLLELRSVLFGMGIDVVQDGDFKLKGVRKSHKKSKAMAGLGLSSGSSQSGVSTGSATSGAVDRRSGLPASPSISSTLTTSPSTGFRAFFGTKKSTTPLGTPSLAGSSPAFPSPALSASGHDDFDLLGSPLAPTTSNFSSYPGTPPMPVYGDQATKDAGEEVRFNVEITKVRALQGLYYVDVKRLKGGAWSYKFVYSELLGRWKHVQTA